MDGIILCCDTYTYLELLKHANARNQRHILWQCERMYLPFCFECLFTLSAIIRNVWKVFHFYLSCQIKRFIVISNCTNACCCWFCFINSLFKMFIHTICYSQSTPYISLLYENHIYTTLLQNRKLYSEQVDTDGRYIVVIPRFVRLYGSWSTC